MQKQNTRVFYIPAQLHFHVEKEVSYLFNSDKATLNEFGRMRLKKALMEGAGFIAKS